MYHSIYIGDKNTWDDFHLVANNRPVVASPEVRTVYIDVPGASGSLDLTTALTGDVLYKNREGSWEFTVVNYYPGFNDENWSLLYSKILSHIHGKKHKIILEDDPEYYYYGRLAVEEWRSNANYSMVTINYNLDPYKYSIAFDEEIAEKYTGLTISGTLTVNAVGTSRPAIPTIMVVLPSGGSMSVTYNGAVYPLTSGANKNPDIVIQGVSTKLVFTGNGTVSIVYQGGEL